MKKKYNCISYKIHEISPGAIQKSNGLNVTCQLLCVRDTGADAADGGYLWRSMWILWMTSSLSSRSTSATVSVS